MYMEDTSKQEILSAVRQEASANRQEILEAIGTFAEQVDLRFERIEGDLSSLKKDVSSLKTDMSSMKTDMVSVKSQMVTKSYLDDKLADLKGDMVSMLRKEDKKVNKLIDVLAEKAVLTPGEAKQVLANKVFP
jgi:hypothetical protein